MHPRASGHLRTHAPAYTHPRGECWATAWLACKVAQRIQASMQEMVQVGDRALRLSVSIGIAALTPERDTVSRMMAAADAALYRAKSEGRNRVCIEH